MLYCIFISYQQKVVFFFLNDRICQETSSWSRYYWCCWPSVPPPFAVCHHCEETHKRSTCQAMLDFCGIAMVTRLWNMLPAAHILNHTFAHTHLCCTNVPQARLRDGDGGRFVVWTQTLAVVAQTNAMRSFLNVKHSQLPHRRQNPTSGQVDHYMSAHRQILY